VDALRSVRAHYADRAFVSLVSVEPAEAEIRRAMIAQSASAALLNGGVLVRLTHSAPVHA
jgi:hypothetical protein